MILTWPKLTGFSLATREVNSTLQRHIHVKSIQCIFLFICLEQHTRYTVVRLIKCISTWLLAMNCEVSHAIITMFTFYCYAHWIGRKLSYQTFLPRPLVLLAGWKKKKKKKKSIKKNWDPTYKDAYRKIIRWSHGVLNTATDTDVCTIKSSCVFLLLFRYNSEGITRKA